MAKRMLLAAAVAALALAVAGMLVVATLLLGGDEAAEAAPEIVPGAAPGPAEAPTAEAAAPASDPSAGSPEGDATGDPAAGEAAFGQCISCHLVQAPSGEILAGRAGRTGPNLYGVAGRLAGSVEGFAYGEGLERLGEAGVAWDEAAFTAYLLDPSGFVGATLGERLRSRMAYALRDPEEARDIHAYLASLAPR